MKNIAKQGRLLALAACALPGVSLSAQTLPAPQPGEARPAPPPREVPDAGLLMQQTGGSLMQAAMLTTPPPADSANRPRIPGFFAVPEPIPRTIRKHDLVTIIIREESEFKSDGSTEQQKDTSLDASIDEFIKLDELFKKGNLKGGGISPPAPSVKFGANRDFNGEAKVDRTDSFITRIQAEVVDVKPNGTFAVQARKRIKIDEEVQEFILTGVARGADVTVDNTVLSTQVYDLNLEKRNSGVVRDGTKRGAIPKLLDALNPF